MFRRFALGAAVVLFAVSSTHAADMLMDVKAPREPVYRCDIVGFIELPGTDICMKIGGHARLVVIASQDNWFGDESFTAGFIIPDSHKLTDTFQMYGQGRVNVDARTATDYGTVRAFIEMEANDNESRTGGPFNLRHAFVQFGNWTFGKTWSVFVHLDSSPDDADPFNVYGDNTIRRSQVRYTQSFASGVSVSVSLEDQEYNDPLAIVANGAYFAPPAPNFVVNDRSSMPDVVAHIRVDGDWGNAQLAGAIHDNKYREVNGAGLAPAPLAGNQVDSDVGWAALFGLVINSPATGEGDYFGFKAIYTDGATEYNQDNVLRSTNVVWGLCNALAPVLGGCIVDNVTTWSALAFFTHNWTPTVATTLGAGYQNVEAPLTVFNATAPLLASNFEQDVYEIFGTIAWTPVPRTQFMLDVHYGHVDFNGVGTFAGVFNPFVANPLAADSDGAFAAAFQVTRSF